MAIKSKLKPAKSSKNKEKIIFLVGPTAIGKSALAVALAQKLNAEIISCDSMQIYKRMDIVTSKPGLALTKKIKHYLVDELSPDKEYNVSDYRRQALACVKKIIKKGKIPLFVGGTGLYMSILVDGIFEVKAQNHALRQRLSCLAQRRGSAYLYNRLKKVDPAAAEKIHPNDARRIIRALEVFKVTGKPISELQKQRHGLADEYDVKIFCLNMDRGKLYKRIDERVDKMFSHGLLDEVKRLLKSKLSKTAFYAIGIRELKGYLECQYDLEEAKRLIKRNSRQYAKRQLTWFRKDKRIRWVDASSKQLANKIYKAVLK